MVTTAETRQQRRHRHRQERKGIAQPQKNAFGRALAAFKARAEALSAASVMVLGAYKSRGHGRGTPSRNYFRPYCNNGGMQRPHASGQECLRRAVGGWAWRKRLTGLSKVEILRAIAPRQRVRLEDAIAVVDGMRRTA